MPSDLPSPFQQASSAQQTSTAKKKIKQKKALCSMVYKARATCPADTFWGSPATSLLPVRQCWVHSWTRNSGFGYTGRGKCHGQSETCDEDQQWLLWLQHLHGACCASGTVTRSGHRDTSYFMFSFKMHCVGRTHAITLPRARKETALAHSWGITTQ